MNKLYQNVDIGPYDDGFYYFDIETVPCHNIQLKLMLAWIQVCQKLSLYNTSILVLVQVNH